MIGEIGGNAEELGRRVYQGTREEAGNRFHRWTNRAPPGRRMGHAGAIISGGKRQSRRQKWPP